MGVSFNDDVMMWVNDDKNTFFAILFIMPDCTRYTAVCHTSSFDQQAFLRMRVQWDRTKPYLYSFIIMPKRIWVLFKSDTLQSH